MNELRELARKIKALVFDVDGVLTDGGMYVDEDGRVMKRFDVRDGLGLKLAGEAGFATAIISGHDSKATHARARALGIAHCLTGIERKDDALDELLRTLGVRREETLFMGDDWLDLPALKIAGLPVTVPHAPDFVKSACRYVTKAEGGRGAVRETIDLVLEAGGHLERIMKRYGTA
jgi:3-deoxy-D-manno-octulosonate 8-phosphate phosphatase (KDO 8-P phosphatase)